MPDINKNSNLAAQVDRNKIKVMPRSKPIGIALLGLTQLFNYLDD